MRPLGPGALIAGGVRVLGHLHRSNRLDVYDAWCERRECRVIAKTLRPDRRSEKPAVRALLREGHLLKRLAHPHLVRAYEVAEVPRPVVIMETLTGETLEHLILRSRLTAAELAVLGTQLASALRYLHSERVVHLDLKPANVIAEAGRAKVIDLSHARAPARVRPGGGTWCYMAPEQSAEERSDRRPTCGGSASCFTSLRPSHGHCSSSPTSSTSTIPSCMPASLRFAPCAAAFRWIWRASSTPVSRLTRRTVLASPRYAGCSSSARRPRRAGGPGGRAGSR